MNIHECSFDLISASYWIHQKKLSLRGVSTQQTIDIRSSVNLLASLCYITQAILGNTNRSPAQCVDILIRLGQKCTELEPMLNSLDGVFKHPCQNLYMSEFRGQFHYLVGTYLLQLGLAKSLPVNDVLSMTTALYALSLHEEAKRRNNLINMGWMPMHARIISKLSCNRVGQIWHFLRNVTESYGEEYLEESQRRWSNGESPRDVFNQAFGAGRNLQFIRSPSFLFSSENEAVTQSHLDNLLSNAFEVNQESVTSDPENFQLLVWTCLQWDTRPDGIPSDFGYFVEETFGNLSFSTNKLKIMAIDNLKLLDIEAFLYAVVLVIRATFASQGMSTLKINKKNLPLLTVKQKLSMKEQEEWFSAVYKLCHSKALAKEYSKLRVIAQRGLEVLRCGSNHGNETQLLVQLGRIMNERRSELVKSDCVGDRSTAYHAMSVMYWTGAMGHLKRLLNDGALPRTQKSFFPHVHKDLKDADLKQYMDEGAVVIAEFYSQNGEVQRGLGYLDDVKSSEGLFTKASMFKKLADEEATPDLEYQLSPTKLTSRGELLDKAKNSLYSTMDSISGRANHPLHEQVKLLLTDIEQEQNYVARKIAEIDGAPSSPMGNESSVYNSFATPGNNSNDTTTNDPSPQRLASEIRSLNFSHLQIEKDRDETKKLLELQNKTLDQNQTMMEQQNKLVEHIMNMTPLVQAEPQTTTRRILQQGSGDSDVLKKISEQNEKLFDVMNSMKMQFDDLTRDVVDLKEKMTKLELEQEKGKVRELEKQVAATAKPSSVASPAPLQVGMPGVSMMPGHKHLYQQSLYQHSGVTYVPHPQYPGYMMPIEGGFHPGMMASTPSVRRSGTPQTMLPGFTGLFDNAGSPTEEDEELKQQFGTAGLGLGEQREYSETSGQSLLTSNQYPQMTNVPSSSIPMRSMLGSWQSPSGAGGSIMSGVAPAHSPNPDAASTLAAYAAAAAGRQQLPTMGAQPVASSLTAPKPIVTSVSTMGTNPSGSSLTVPRPIVTSVSTAKPSSQGLLIKSPTPASQPSATIPTKPEGTTQSPFAGFSFNKAVTSTSGFSSTPAFHVPQSNTATTGATTSPFAGFSFKPSPAKMDNPITGIGSLGTSQAAPGGGSPAQQYPQLTALLSTTGMPINQEDGEPDSPRPGFYTPSQPSENSARKPGQSPMSLTTTATASSQPKGTEKAPVIPQEGYDKDVIFVMERKATPEQIAKAEKLLLPPHFYLYEDSPPCPGCRGCEEDDLKAETATDGGSQPEQGRSVFVEKSKGPATPTTGLFSNTALTGLSFATLSADGDASFKKSETSKPFSFANAGAQVFGSASKHDNSNASEEYDPHYEPIISLPEKVNIKTGDEGEEVMFRERSKLYRFDRSTNAWKERGVGEMKILKNPETGRTRILMRREQVLKVCANHWLTPNMKLEPMSSSDCAWVWFASDFSEGEECHEQFAIKFKTPNLAAEFKETFDNMKDVGAQSFNKPPEEEKEEQEGVEEKEEQEGVEEKEEQEGVQENEEQEGVTPAKEEQMGDTLAEEEQEKPASKEEDDMSNRFQAADPVVTQRQKEEEDNAEYEGEYDGEEEEYGEDDYDDDEEEEEEDEDYEDYEYEDEDDDAKPSLADQVKPPADSWECDACRVTNTVDALVCLACQAPKAGTSASESKPSLADQFKPLADSWECDACMIMNKADTLVCEACQTPKPGTSVDPQPGSSGGFNFGDSKPSLADQVKPPADSWECDACRVTNTVDALVCLACQAPKAGTSASESKPSLADQFKPLADSWECDACMIMNKADILVCEACQTPKPGTSVDPRPGSSGGFNFGDSKAVGPFTISSSLGGPFTTSSTLGSSPFNFQSLTTSTPSAFSAGTSSAVFKIPPGSSFSFGAPAQTSTPTMSSIGSGFKLPPGAFSITQPTPESTTEDAAARSSTMKDSTPTMSSIGSGFKLPPGACSITQPTPESTTEDAAARSSTMKDSAPSLFSPATSNTQVSLEPVKSDADSTTKDTTDRDTPTGIQVDPTDQSTKPTATTSTAAPKLFSFGGAMAQFSFGSPNQSKPSSGYSFGSSPKDTDSNVSSGSKTEPAASSQPGVASGGSQTATTFGNTSTTNSAAVQGFSFAPKPPSSPNATGENGAATLSFSELVKSQGFNFRLDVDNVASSPPRSNVKSPVKSPGLNKSGEYYQDDERDDIYFEPVVTLPDNVKIETGEEGEDIKFSHRAKLYRFDLEGSQWKERGVGDIKVLYNPESKKHRIVMRREQVLKVCANHYITEHVDLQPNKGSDRSWVWHAMDVSDGEVQNEQLAVRFKTEEAAKDFKSAVDKAKKEI